MLFSKIRTYGSYTGAVTQGDAENIYNSAGQPTVEDEYERTDLASLGPRFARRRRNTYVRTYVRTDFRIFRFPNFRFFKLLDFWIFGLLICWIFGIFNYSAFSKF